MKFLTTSSNCILVVVLFTLSFIGSSAPAPPTNASLQKITCLSRRSRCFLRTITCPKECPTTKLSNPKSKVCHVNCDSPICKAECKHRKPNCNGSGAACYDPRFIGGDGIVFYFHGRSNEHFTLLSDNNLQINAHFIGLRPAGRTRDYTWIQSLGILFGVHTFSLEATKSATWDDEIDHLKFSYNGKDAFLPEGLLSVWTQKMIKVERISNTNSVIISLQDIMEIAVNVVPVTKEDDRIHNYQIPSDDCFTHLEVQFRFFGLSRDVEGVLGHTYRPDFENPAKPGVAMAVVGGEDKYRTTSLLSADCKACLFSPTRYPIQDSAVGEYGTVDCTAGLSGGNGIVCKK